MALTLYRLLMKVVPFIYSYTTTPNKYNKQRYTTTSIRINSEYGRSECHYIAIKIGCIYQNRSETDEAINGTNCNAQWSSVCKSSRCLIVLREISSNKLRCRTSSKLPSHTGVNIICISPSMLLFGYGTWSGANLWIYQIPGVISFFVRF